MWKEQRPEQGDTVKIEFSEWTAKEPRIGVFEGYHGGKAVVDIGNRILCLDSNTTFNVWFPTKYFT